MSDASIRRGNYFRSQPPHALRKLRIHRPLRTLQGLFAVALFGAPILVGAGWWYARRQSVTPLWRRLVLWLALSAVTVDTTLFYGWLVWRLVAGESQHVFAVKYWLADHLTLYLALAALIPAALGKGTARICTIVAALFHLLLWSNFGIL